eukprot:SAG22_NODE_1455_length_4387_cov_108.989972_6_plen_141_part_00
MLGWLYLVFPALWLRSKLKAADLPALRQAAAEPQDPPADTTEWMAIELTLTFQINPEIQRTVTKNVLMPTADYASALPEDSEAMKGLMIGEVWELLQHSELIPMVRSDNGNMREATMGDVVDVRLSILGQGPIEAVNHLR